MTILDVTNREMRLGAISPARKISSGDEAPSDSIKRVALAGWLIIAIFFGGIGSWAATAPLNGAVVGNAVVKVDGNRKSVQHLDGGIVKELYVKEGDKVGAGDVLVVLDETQARAEYDVLSQQYVVLRATEARLLAELAHSSELVMPEDLKTQDSYFKSVWNGQVSQFESRRAALEGQSSVIREKINQLGSQIVGAEAHERQGGARPHGYPLALCRTGGGAHRVLGRWRHSAWREVFRHRAGSGFADHRGADRGGGH